MGRRKLNAADTIDDMVVRHLLAKSDPRYGDYVDLDEFEKYRVALSKAQARRKQRTELTSKRHSVTEELRDSMGLQTSLFNQNQDQLTSYFKSTED